MSIEKDKTALVAEGGAMQGAYVLGVLYALRDLGIKADYFDLIAASSASAATMAYWIADQFDEGAQIWEKELSSRKFLNELKLLVGGSILNLDYLVDYLMKEKIPLQVEKIKKANLEFLVTATQWETGEAVIFSNKQQDIDLFAVIKASMALPVAYKKQIEVNGKLYVDGGLTQPVPVNAVENKAKSILVISTKPRFYFKTQKSNWLLKAEIDRLPKSIRELMLNREKYHDLAWSKISNLLKKGYEVVVIRPSEPLPISKYDNNRNKILATIQQGKQDAIKNKVLREFIDKLKNKKQKD